LGRNFTSTQQLCLQFLGIIIGSIIGEQIGGAISDYWMNRRARKISARPPPEFQLWLSYSGYLLTISGVVVFLVRIEQVPELHWNVTPIISATIAGAGNQVVTTVLITYAVDYYHEEAASIGVFITFVRQMWGFIGPFW
jgi:MFS family permease